jgi:hypothetical protein
MTDPKLDEIPAGAEGASGQKRGQAASRPRQGLSINDTIAA